MKKPSLAFLGPALLLILAACGTTGPGTLGSERVEASPKDGFEFAYYLYIPARLTHGEILVVPNNSGMINDAISVHEDRVKTDLSRYGVWFADRLGCALLMPVFPRSKTKWKVYTHALDRETLLSEGGLSPRLDLQLRNMVVHAQARLKSRGQKSVQKILLFGFSAAGMFANRASLIHPDIVAGVAVGSPGGWPIAPVSSFKGRPLPYPVGISDLSQLTGQEVDLQEFGRLPQFLFMGEEDLNDSVPYSDGYDPDQKILVFSQFGPTPRERWEKSRALYQTVSDQADFRLYPRTGHRLSEAMISDTVRFFQSVLENSR